jgi:hypothetical protein
MIRSLTHSITSWRAKRIRKGFERAFAAYDRQIAEVRAKHGRVRDAEAEKSQAVHAALRGAR